MSLLVAAILAPFAVVTGFFLLEVLVGLPRAPDARRRCRDAAASDRDPRSGP